MPLFNEDMYERALIELFTQHLGYNHLYGPGVERDYNSPLYNDELYSALSGINKALPSQAIKEAIYKLQNFESADLILKNHTFMDYLQNGVSVNYTHNGEQKSSIVYLADFSNIDNNSFIIANQWTIIEGCEKRPDIIIFINGLPLVVMELKTFVDENISISQAYRQLRNYMQKTDIPSLFVYNAFLVISDMANSKAGTITSGEDRFMEWKTIDGDYENTQCADFNVFFRGMFEKARLLDIIKNFICFSKNDKGYAKILAGYHQYFAVKKAVESTRHATTTNGKGGVFWHTQGSGKSLSMVFYAKQLQDALSSPTIVVMTDRNDLDNQLYSQFSKCSEFLRQIPVQAESRQSLKELLANRQANGIIFTTMQKFEESDEPLSERRNIIVMADEAHRGQYGLEEKMNEQTGKVVIGSARIIRDNLPNATYIGFTGTPISSKDRNTREIFGDYIDIYDMTQAVEDGATRPVYYESRVINLKLDKSVLEQIDNEYDLLAQQADPDKIAKSKKELGKIESILGAPETISSLCADILDHYENYRENLLTGKAMIVAYSRPIAIKIYEKILELRPEWTDKVKVVMTSGNDDPEEWRSIIGNKAYKEELARKFKDNDDPMKIAIVVDMWLTGFDVPSLATMYVYKPMNGHNLMQAIARVNRVYKDKEGGLVVDYVGIASALKHAMNDYTKRDRKNFNEMDIGKSSYPIFLEKLEVCADMLYGYDYIKNLYGSDLERANTIKDGVDFLLSPDKTENKDNFIKESMLLKQAGTLCMSLQKPEERLKAAYFEALRVTLTKTNGNSGKLSIIEINRIINDLLKQSIKSEGVINLFKDVKEEFSLFDPNFLEDISRMKQKNLAVEIMKKLIAEQVSVYRRTNVVKSEKFSDKLSKLMNSYLNGMLTNEEVIEELMKMADEISKAHLQGNELGLSEEEMAFYDALTKPKAIKDFYENAQLVAITKELTEMLHKNRTIDWQRKENARAGMRKMVKRLLAKYKYPPDEVPQAIDIVISQCEMWTDNAEEVS